MDEIERLQSIEDLIREPELIRGLKKLRKQCMEGSDWAKIIDEALPSATKKAKVK
jgi:hypothetical protein